MMQKRANRRFDDEVSFYYFDTVNNMQPSQNQSHLTSKLRLIAVVVIAGFAGVYVTSILHDDDETKFVGYLAAETSIVVTDRQAEIVQMHVSQGEEIKPNKLIATLTDLEQSQRVIQLKEAFIKNQLLLEQATAQVDVEVTWRTRTIETDLHRTQIESAGFLKKQLDLKMEVLAINSLVPQNRSNTNIKQSAFMTLSQGSPRTKNERMTLMLQKEANRNATEVIEAQLSICEQRVERLNNLIDALPEKIERSHNLPFLKNEQTRLMKSLQQADTLKTNIQIHAKSYGTVGIVYHNVGDKIKTGEPLAMLLDQQQRSLIVHVPSTKIHKFATGKKEQQKLTLTFAGGITRTGVVHSIPPQAVKEQQGNNTATVQIVKVRVTPFGKPWPQLPIGSQVDVSLQK